MKEIKIKDGSYTYQIKEESKKKVSDILLEHKTMISMPCSGRGSCGKCKVMVEGEVNKITKIEHEKLTPQEIKKGIRLACCTIAMGDIEIKTQFHEKEEAQIEAEVILGDEIIDSCYDNYAVVVDLGTTTMVLKLLSQKEIIATQSMVNPQISFGGDVVSRIQSSLEGKGERLQQQVLDAINEMIIKACKQVNISNREIDYAIITGNTAMLLLLFGYPVESMAIAPFHSEELFGKKYKWNQLPLSISELSNIEIPPCISAYVGADITTAISYCDFYGSNQNIMMIDIGTNGEIALWSKEKLLVASTAAGPAFEGADIYMGMNGQTGAIDTMYIEGDEIKYTVIGNVKPVGICGSGIISAIATMINANIIDETGEILFENSLYKKYQIEFEELLAFKIDEIIITQKDIRMVQLAKASIYAGIKTLVETANLTFEDIDILYIAGGFGKHINIKDAAVIGLIPEYLLKKANSIGNAALGGAVKLAFYKNSMVQQMEIAQTAKLVELAGNPLFSEYYIEAMMFE